MGDRSCVAKAPTIGDAESVSPAPHGGDLDAQIVDATRTLIGRWGVAKTTVSDIAREAQCSRATVYRAFPGGKNELLASLGRAEVTLFFDQLADLADACDTLEDALIAVICASGDVLGSHEGFQFMLEHEPGMMLPYLGFKRIDRLYLTIRERLGPHFERFVGELAGWTVEWAARIALSYVFQPSPTFDLSDPARVRQLVVTRMLPGLVTQSLVSSQAESL